MLLRMASSHALEWTLRGPTGSGDQQPRERPLRARLAAAHRRDYRSDASLARRVGKPDTEWPLSPAALSPILSRERGVPPGINIEVRHSRELTDDQSVAATHC